MRLTDPWNAPRHARLIALRDSEAGFTLIEMLVSALILVLIGAAVAEALVASAQVSGDQRRRSQAAQVAQQDQERLRGLSVAQLNFLNQVPPRTVTVDSVAYTVTSSAHFLNNTGGPSCIPGAAAYFQITSSVNWIPNRRGAVVAESIIAPPAGGTIRAQVQDQTAAPLSGVTVSASGPDVESATTDNGCAVLSGLPSGSYNVTYALLGYVDPNGNASPPNISATVTSTGNAIPSTDPVMMGPAGTVTGTFKAYVNDTNTDTGEADTISWYGTGATTSMTTSKSVSQSSVATSLGTTALFPFAFTGPSYVNNYQVWAGACRQMQPPSGVNMVGVGPGATPTMTVAEPEVDVFVTNGARIKPSHVKFYFSSTSGTTCTDSWAPTIASDATTNTHGVLANAGQPYATSNSSQSASGLTGQLTVCADNGSRRKTSPAFTDSYANVTTVNLDLSTNYQSGTCP